MHNIMCCALHYAREDVALYLLGEFGALRPNAFKKLLQSSEFLKYRMDALHMPVLLKYLNKAELNTTISKEKELRSLVI